MVGRIFSVRLIKVNASSRSSRTVNRPDTAVHMEEGDPKNPPEGTSFDSGRRSSPRAAKEAQTEIKAHRAIIDPTTRATSLSVPLQSLNQETPVPVPSSPPQHRSLMKSRTKKKSKANKDCEEAAVTIEAPKKPNKRGGQAKEENASREKAISAAPVPSLYSSSISRFEIITLSKVNPPSIPPKTFDQVDHSPARKHLP